MVGVNSNNQLMTAATSSGRLIGTRRVSYIIYLTDETCVRTGVYLNDAVMAPTDGTDEVDDDVSQYRDGIIKRMLHVGSKCLASTVEDEVERW